MHMPRLTLPSLAHPGEIYKETSKQQEPHEAKMALIVADMAE
jgi:hypothetical protein